MNLSPQKTFEETKFLIGIPYASDMVPIQFALSLRDLTLPPNS